MAPRGALWCIAFLLCVPGLFCWKTEPRKQGNLEMKSTIAVLVAVCMSIVLGSNAFAQTTVFFDDFLRDEQPQSGPFTTFGREEVLEDALTDSARDTLAVVFDVEDIIPIAITSRGQ